MTVQTILTVIAWVFSVIAISVAFSASTLAKETERLVWRLNKEDHERRMREIGDREQISHRVYVLETRGKEFEKRINSITEGKDREPCRPRTCCGTAGDKILVGLPERKCEDEITEKDWWKNQYSELRAKYDVVVVENKKLEEKYERLRESIKTIERVSGYCDKKKGE